MRRSLLPLAVPVVLALGAVAMVTLDARRPPAPPAAPVQAPSKAPPKAAPAPAPAPRDPAAFLPGALSARNANYSIDVTLDRDRRMLRGREILTWRNISRNATGELRFHLYYNAWKNTRSTWLREGLLSGRRHLTRTLPPEDWGWIDVTAIRLIPGSAPPVDLTASQRFIAPDDGNADDQTVMAVP
ncbi:MAG: hypothetical protein IMZ65_03580, partial [Planctomycetes bacterium]|nr:hypothetical protein [Planctomycetota bacterium]